MTQQTDNTPQTAVQPAPTPYIRLRGLILLIIGLGMAKWQIYDPLHAKENGVTEVTISSTMMALGIILPILGLAIMVAGNSIEKFFADIQVDPKRLTWKSVAFLLTMALIGGGAWIWVQMALSAQGFH
ncbi:MAG TPA: hypothetical protein VIU93_02675 [Gallionellaceae bacterium]